MISIAKEVTKLRFWYHANAADMTNALWQLHLISGEKADKINKAHAFAIVECMEHLTQEDAYKALHYKK